jgi:undecaprenyl-diphosphatase
MRRKRLLLVAVCAATVIASFSSWFLALDARLMDWLRENRTGQYTDAALMVTALGSTPVALGILAIATLFFLAYRWWFDLAFLLLSIIGGTQLNPLLKDLFDRPRPFFPDQALIFKGSGFPSGHAMTATIVCGGLVVILMRHESRAAHRWWTIAAATLLVALVAATRVYLGAHFLTDVMGGVAFGLLWLTICDFLIRRLESRARRGRP